MGEQKINNLSSTFSLQHAGEIYGEKAILATELKELQSRLTTLSGERDKSLAILEEVLYKLQFVYIGKKFIILSLHVSTFQNT